ncbi:MAG TPA: hypothetical protein VIN09_14800, partial [Chloroflexota bacterium]
VHGGPPTESPHFGPFVQPLDPPELGEAISTTRWQGFEVVHLGPVLPFHRTITLALGPAIPGDRPPEVVWQRMQRLRERPDGVLTIPVDPGRVAKYIRAGRSPVVAQVGDVRVEALSFVAGVTGMQVALLMEPPTDALSLGGPSPLRLPPSELPPGTPEELWREALVPGQPWAFAASASWPTDGAPRRTPLLLQPWRARSLPDGEPLDPHAICTRPGGRSVFTFDAPPLGANGVRLELVGAYRWEPVVATVDVPPPRSGRAMDLRGVSLSWNGDRLDLLRWEPGRDHFTLIARPSHGFDGRDWPAWLPDLRLMVGNGSVGLPLVLCDDGSFTVVVPAGRVGDAPARLGLRAVGRRLATIALDLAFVG